MFLLLLIGVPVVEVFVFVEVARAIGWLLAFVLLLGTSVLGIWLVRVLARSTIERVFAAVSEHRASPHGALDVALGFLGAVLLAIPGFLGDLLGILLLLPPTRALIRRWISHSYADRLVRYAATAGRFAPGTGGRQPGDIDSTAVDHDFERLGP